MGHVISSEVTPQGQFFSPLMTRYILLVLTLGPQSVTRSHFRVEEIDSSGAIKEF